MIETPTRDPSVREHPYASFVHKVQKPGRYLGGEFGASVKDWSAVQARICLAFPDVYDIGMSHLGFKILYKILNDDPRTLAERAYTPWVDMQAELRARSLPLLSLESARPLRDFDVVGFSLQFELTYTNVLTMMDLGGIPLRASERGEEDPLVIAGGPTATHPEPISAFIDAIVVGDGEERTTEVALLWTSLRAAGVPRAERLVALSRLRGVYVPSLYATREDPDTGFQVVDRALAPGAPLPVERSLVADLNDYPFPDDGPVGGPEAIFDRMSIEIARGCTEGCRFCQAGMIYRPVRERDPDAIVKSVVSAITKSGYDEASLTSLSTADYSCIAPLIKKVVAELTPKKVSLGVSSLRAYGLEEDVLDDLQRVRASGVTFAPEAGSQRMRDVINKNVTEEQLMTTAERIFARGWSSMKLYFMIGLPTEEESDVREIVRVGARARDVGRRVKRERKSGGAPKVTVSVSTHVPKPHTPFQWCAMDTSSEVRKKQAWLEEEKRASGGVELKMHDSEVSWLEGVFARGDRALCNVLERAYRAGARFDSWEDQLQLEVWGEAFDAEGIDVARYLGTIPVTARLPWDHISVGLEDGFLAREYRKALKSRLSLPCGKAAGMFIHHTNLDAAVTDARKLVCYDCGVACDLGAMREERLVYLTRLGAQTRIEAKPLPAIPEAGKRKGPPPMIVQAEARRYRFGYTKLGPSAFLSHLDLIRALPRAFRRLEVPLFYSSGYHPKPDMVFAPALSLGVSSLCEFVDLKISADVDAASLVDALSEGSPDGLRFFGGTRLGANDAGISRIVDAARYAVAVPRSVIDGLAGEGGGEAWLAGEVARVLAAAELPVVRRIDGIGKRVNVREFVRGIELGSDAAREAVRAAGLVGDLVSLLVDVEIRGSGSAKIAEVMEVIVNGAIPEVDGGLPYRAVRVAMGTWKGDGVIASPLDLPAVRKGQHTREDPDAARDEAIAVEASA
jgi:radical SAM family uncharacterized protein/radical SAM-linked protein